MRAIPWKLFSVASLSVAFALVAACGGDTDDGGTTGGLGGSSGSAGSGGSSGSSGAGGSGGGVDCSALDARSDGTECAALLGYTWDGTRCAEVICGCEGTACAQLYDSELECLNARGGCPGVQVPCGNVTCAEGQYCCNASCGTCVAPGEGCTAIACENPGTGGSGGTSSGPELCGHRLCVGNESCCNASCGTCTPPGIDCTDQACPPNCEAMDATGVGPCDAEIGYVWDGDSCDSVSGCDCAGQDCGWVYPNLEVCQAARAMCDGDL